MAPRHKAEGTGEKGELLVSIEQYTRTRDAVSLPLLLVFFCGAATRHPHVVVPWQLESAQTQRASPAAMPVARLVVSGVLIASSMRLRRWAFDRLSRCAAVTKGALQRD
jgi:hypothetical protein